MSFAQLYAGDRPFSLPDFCPGGAGRHRRRLLHHSRLAPVIAGTRIVEPISIALKPVLSEHDGLVVLILSEGEVTWYECHYSNRRAVPASPPLFSDSRFGVSRLISAQHHQLYRFAFCQLNELVKRLFSATSFSCGPAIKHKGFRLG